MLNPRVLSQMATYEAASSGAIGPYLRTSRILLHAAGRLGSATSVEMMRSYPWSAAYRCVAAQVDLESKV